MVMNISCKIEKSTYYTLPSRGVTRKYLHTAVVYSCVIHSVQRMLFGGYNYGYSKKIIMVLASEQSLTDRKTIIFGTANGSQIICFKTCFKKKRPSP